MKVGLMVAHRGPGIRGEARTVNAPGDHAEQAFARPAGVTDQPRVGPHQKLIVLPYPPARARRVPVRHGGVGGRANGCTPRAWARGRGTHSARTRRARWASVCTPRRRDGSAKSRPPSEADRTAIRQRVHREPPLATTALAVGLKVVRCGGGLGEVAHTVHAPGEHVRQA